MNDIVDMVFEIETLEDADQALHKLAEAMRKIQAIEADAEAKISRITEEKIQEAKPIHEQIEIMEQELVNFMEKNRASLFSLERSQQLNYGTIGYRKSSKIKICKDTMKLIKDFKYLDGLRITEKLNKEAMKDWPAEKLSQVKAKKVVKDNPYYETNEFQIKDL